MPDQAQQILSGFAGPDDLKAQAWQHFTDSADQADLAKRLQGLALPNAVKDQLQAAKKGPAAKPAGPSAQPGTASLTNAAAAVPAPPAESPGFLEWAQTPFPVGKRMIEKRHAETAPQLLPKLNETPGQAFKRTLVPHLRNAAAEFAGGVMSPLGLGLMATDATEAAAALKGVPALSPWLSSLARMVSGGAAGTQAVQGLVDVGQGNYAQGAQDLGFGTLGVLGAARGAHGEPGKPAVPEPPKPTSAAARPASTATAFDAPMVAEPVAPAGYGAPTFAKKGSTVTTPKGVVEGKPTAQLPVMPRKSGTGTAWGLTPPPEAAPTTASATPAAAPVAEPAGTAQLAAATSTMPTMRVPEPPPQVDQHGVPMAGNALSDLDRDALNVFAEGKQLGTVTDERILKEIADNHTEGQPASAYVQGLMEILTGQQMSGMPIKGKPKSTVQPTGKPRGALGAKERPYRPADQVKGTPYSDVQAPVGTFADKAKAEAAFGMKQGALQPEATKSADHQAAVNEAAAKAKADAFLATLSPEERATLTGNGTLGPLVKADAPIGVAPELATSTKKKGGAKIKATGVAAMPSEEPAVAVDEVPAAPPAAGARFDASKPKFAYDVPGKKKGSSAKPNAAVESAFGGESPTAPVAAVEGFRPDPTGQPGRVASKVAYLRDEAKAKARDLSAKYPGLNAGIVADPAGKGWLISGDAEVAKQIKGGVTAELPAPPAAPPTPVKAAPVVPEAPTGPASMIKKAEAAAIERKATTTTKAATYVASKSPVPLMNPKEVPKHLSSLGTEELRQLDKAFMERNAGVVPKSREGAPARPAGRLTNEERKTWSAVKTVLATRPRSSAPVREVAEPSSFSGLKPMERTAGPEFVPDTERVTPEQAKERGFVELTKGPKADMRAVIKAVQDRHGNSMFRVTSWGKGYRIEVDPSVVPDMQAKLPDGVSRALSVGDDDVKFGTDATNVNKLRVPEAPQSAAKAAGPRTVENAFGGGPAGRAPFAETAKADRPIEAQIIDELRKKLATSSSVEQGAIRARIKELTAKLEQDPDVTKLHGGLGLPAPEQLKRLPAALNKIFNPASAATKAVGADPVADVLRRFHDPDAAAVLFNNATSASTDKTFRDLRDSFAEMSSEQRAVLNRLRGDAATPEGKKIQAQAMEDAKRLGVDKAVLTGVKDASDWAHKMAKSLGFDLGYRDDYFYGAYKNRASVEKFLDHWQTNERFTKEKTYASPADAEAWGLQLRDDNPITNIEREVQTVARRAAMKGLLKQVEDTTPTYAVKRADATVDQRKQWDRIADPLFDKDGWLFHPDYANLVNNLLETNKITQSTFAKSLQNMSRVGQSIKMFGSVFHLRNVMKAAVSSEPYGMANPAGWRNVINAFGKGVDEKSPAYVDYVNNGGGHRRSVEADAANILAKGFESTYRALKDTPLGPLIGKANPISPEFTKWMFDSFIPGVKFNKYQNDLMTFSAEHGRAPSDAEKQSLIRRNDEIHGEINERLFGRSGTVTSALRLFFMAPGYAEGNFRITARALKDMDPAALSFIGKSLAMTAASAALGTKIMTGKWPGAPKKAEDLRDAFKIQTGQKDNKGNDIYYDMMTYEKDPWSIAGNLMTGQPDKMKEELPRRVTGMLGPGYLLTSDLSQFIAHKVVSDGAGRPIYRSTEPRDQQFAKLLAYEGEQLAPISLSTFNTANRMGLSPKQAAVQSVFGVTPTNSEAVRRGKAVRLQQIEQSKQRQEDRKAQRALPPPPLTTPITGR